MTRIKRTCFPKLICLLIFGGIFFFGATHGSMNSKKSSKAEDQQQASASEKYLFVWAGDQARIAPDFLAVVDFDESSPNYGKVITKVQLSGPGSSGNEPHHVGLSSDGRVLACGGLLS